SRRIAGEPGVAGESGETGTPAGSAAPVAASVTAATAERPRAADTARTLPAALARRADTPCAAAGGLLRRLVDEHPLLVVAAPVVEANGFVLALAGDTGNATDRARAGRSDRRGPARGLRRGRQAGRSRQRGAPGWASPSGLLGAGRRSLVRPNEI